MTVQELISWLEMASLNDIVEFDISIEDVDSGIFLQGRKNFNIDFGKDVLIVEIN